MPNAGGALSGAAGGAKFGSMFGPWGGLIGGGIGLLGGLLGGGGGSSSGTGPKGGFSDQLLGNASNVLGGWYGGGGGANWSTGLGMNNLREILASKGALDPRFKNVAVANTMRLGQGQQQAIGGQMAQRGLQNSGLGMALQQSAGNSAANRASGMEADFAQMQDQQKRQDLDLLLRLLIQPAMDQSALALGQYNQSSQNRSNQNASLLGALGTALGGYFSGKK